MSDDKEISRRSRKAKRYFEYGEDVAHKGNYDYAIECMVNGLHLVPDDLENHRELRRIALLRTARGGGPVARDRGEIATESDYDWLALAQWRWSHDPANGKLALGVMSVAVIAGLHDLARWVGDVILDDNEHAKVRTERDDLVKLAQLYEKLGDTEQAGRVRRMIID